MFSAIHELENHRNLTASSLSLASFGSHCPLPSLCFFRLSRLRFSYSKALLGLSIGHIRLYAIGNLSVCTSTRAQSRDFEENGDREKPKNHIIRRWVSFRLLTLIQEAKRVFCATCDRETMTLEKLVANDMNESLILLHS